MDTSYLRSRFGRAAFAAAFAAWVWLATGVEADEQDEPAKPGVSPVLKVGSSGDEVRLLQKILNANK
jgi:peptidoglycan hydrolase-like protein with peptidoglycan-binding domain